MNYGNDMIFIEGIPIGTTGSIAVDITEGISALTSVGNDGGISALTSAGIDGGISWDIFTGFSVCFISNFGIWYVGI